MRTFQRFDFSDAWQKRSLQGIIKNFRVMSLSISFTLLSALQVSAEECLPPIQFAGGDAQFAAANQARVHRVKQIPGLVALWDFVERRNSWETDKPFVSIPGESGGQVYELEPRNISLDFWNEGPKTTLADFKLLGRGPFGQAVRFEDPLSKDNLPVLSVPRNKLHDSALDIKGKGKSVTMVVWMLYEKGNHAIAGMWHEGTVTPKYEPPVLQEPGKRQYGLFAGLQANKGGLGAHIYQRMVVHHSEISMHGTWLQHLEK